MTETTRRTRLLVVLAAGILLALAAIGATPIVQTTTGSLPGPLKVFGAQPAHAATCTGMSQADFDAWMSEFGGSYHDPNFAGWGDSLGRVQSVFADGCNGTWGDLFAPGTKCGILDNVQWHVWVQPDGDENWIAFRDHGPAATPRWTAQCKAGVHIGSTSKWKFGPYTESHLKHAKAAAPKDPCFFNRGEYFDWYNGPRWDTRLVTVENNAACTGTWGSWSGDWKGHTEKRRVWPRSDGGQTRIVFALYDGQWLAHDTSETGNELVDPTPDYTRDCEWPRPTGNPCTPA